ncbi:MAG: hypothetical protein HKN41_12325 [Ilumatobacter sp.]|nr:hypothetical protein [Ilumatobacter sp.]
MTLPRLHLPRPMVGRRQPRFEKSVQHDRLSTPSDLVLRNYNSVKGLHR